MENVLLAVQLVLRERPQSMRDPSRVSFMNL